MADPTIRLSTCRGDGRCPECGDIPRPRDPVLTCGCKVDNQWCINGHWRALLTEAIRQRDDYSDRAKASMLIAEARTGPEHDCFFREARDAAIREAASRYDCHGGPGTTTEPCGACVSCVMRRAEKAERERDEARAQVRAFQRAAEASVERQRGDAAIYQRDKERERADRAEALLREIQPMVVQAVLDPYPVVRERASALLAKIREVLG